MQPNGNLWVWRVFFYASSFRNMATSTSAVFLGALNEKKTVFRLFVNCLFLAYKFLIIFFNFFFFCIPYECFPAKLLFIFETTNWNSEKAWKCERNYIFLVIYVIFDTIYCRNAGAYKMKTFILCNLDFEKKNRCFSLPFT